MTYLSVNMQKQNFRYLLHCEVIKTLMEMRCFQDWVETEMGVKRISELEVGSSLNLHEDLLSLF